MTDFLNNGLSGQLSGMDLMIAKTLLLFAVAFFLPALAAFVVTPARRRPRHAAPRPMVLEDEPQAVPQPQPVVQPKPAPRPAPASVSYLDAAAEAFTAGVTARPYAASVRDPYTPLPPGMVHGATTVAVAAGAGNITFRPQGDNLQRRVSSLAAMTPASIASAVQQAGTGLEPLRLPVPQGAPDDLTVISGLSVAAEAELNMLGIWHYWQVAGWGPEEVAWVANRIRPADRIARENWMAQAAKLARIG